MVVGVVKLFGLCCVPILVCCVFNFCFFFFEGLLLIKVILKKKFKIQENFNNRNDDGLAV